MSVELRNGTDEYTELVPEDAKEVIARLETIDTELMRGAISERFVPKLRLQQLLLETTALHSFFANRYFKWKAILDNREVEAYIGLKRNILAGGNKFVSAPAEREAAYEVRPVQYLVGVYEGNLKRCEQYVNSMKKLLETFESERQKS